MSTQHSTRYVRANLAIEPLHDEPLIRAVPNESRGEALRPWFARHGESILVLAILVVTGITFAINMFDLPYYENDEGTYIMQAWSVINQGALAPYTYIYDHAPLGWIQIAGWVELTGGFYTFGNSIDSGRVMMLVIHLLSIFLVYRIVRNITGSVVAAATTTILFAFSAYGIYYGRRVLIDNIATVWMLWSILLLVSKRLTLRRVWLSAFALGVSVLSKEVTLFVIPVLAYLTYYCSHRQQKWFASVGWTAIVSGIISLYILTAALKDELFPTGTLLGGTRVHVSLLTTMAWQARRGRDKGILDFHSIFWNEALKWIHDEPLLVVGGTACAVLSMLMIRRHRIAGTLGLVTLSLWAFFARGGIILDHYLLPLIPIMAINIGLLLWILAVSVSGHGVDRARGPRIRGLALLLIGCAGAILGLIGGYKNPRLGFAADPRELWNVPQARAQQESIAWVQSHVPRSARVVVDGFAWTDLHELTGSGRPFRRVDWYWKIDQDPAIKGKIYHANWRNIDYIVYTQQIPFSIATDGLTIMRQAVQHSQKLIAWNTGGWEVDVLRVQHPGVPQLTGFSNQANRVAIGDHRVVVTTKPNSRIQVTWTVVSNSSTAQNGGVQRRYVANSVANDMGVSTMYLTSSFKPLRPTRVLVTTRITTLNGMSTLQTASVIIR